MHRMHPVRTAPGPRHGPRHTGPPGHRVTLSDRQMMTGPARGHALRLADATLHAGSATAVIQLDHDYRALTPGEHASTDDSARNDPANWPDGGQSPAWPPSTEVPRPLAEIRRFPAPAPGAAAPPPRRSLPRKFGRPSAHADAWAYSPRRGLAVAPLADQWTANSVGHEDRASPHARSEGHCASPVQVDAQTRVVRPRPGKVLPEFDQTWSGRHRRLSAWRSISSSSGSGPNSQTSYAQRHAAAILAAHSSASSREGTWTIVTPPMASGYGPSAADEIEQLMAADERYVRQITGLTVDRLV